MRELCADVLQLVTFISVIPVAANQMSDVRAPGSWQERGRLRSRAAAASS